MTYKQKKAKIKSLVKEMLSDRHKRMVDKIDHLLSSGSVPVTDWDPNNTPYHLPRLILTALLDDAAAIESPRNIPGERKAKMEIKNFRRFL